MHETRPYPIISTLLAGRALAVAESDLDHLSEQVGARPLARAFETARAILGALEGRALPPDEVSEGVLCPRLSGPVEVPEGLRPLLGEFAYLALEMGRHGDALRLFGALAQLAPDSAVGLSGRSQVLVLLEREDEAVEAATAAVEREPESAEAVASLAEALIFAGRPGEARVAITRARRPMGPGASWLRLMRLGLDEGWIHGAQSCA